MNILIFEYKNFGIEDVKDALTSMGHAYTCVTSELLRERISSEFNTLFLTEIEKVHYDCVFTFNYSPVISNNCKNSDIPYIAYIYDSPLVLLYSYTIINPCNYIFIFDKTLYLELKSGGINTVYYCPLAVNTDRLNAMTNKDSDVLNSITSSNNAIAFVGSMYNEKHNLFDRLKNLSPYTEGYLNGIMDAQLKVYGEYFIENLLTPAILNDMRKSVPVEPHSDGIETESYLYAYYFIARKLAEKERHQILSKLSATHTVNLYTPAPTPELPHVNNLGPVDYYDHMPYIFNKSAINLNITLRSIRSGIPLRGMDIMGSGGFLMSNYQEDFYDYFTPGEDLILYESQDDLMRKCSYYLSHDNERRQIAANGYGKVQKSHTYKVRLNEIFETVFG